MKKKEMTPKEARAILEVYQADILESLWLTYEQRKRLDEALDMAINTLEKSSWIPVSKRLPEENISVIGTTKYNDIYETELYDDCGEHKWYADGCYDVPIVAWIPLPEQYEEESEEEE